VANLPDRIDRVILWVTRALGALGAAAIAGMAVLTVLAVVMRYALGAPFAFTEDLAGLMLVSAVFLGVPYAVASHAHIRVNIAYDRTNGWARRGMFVLGQVVFLAFAAVFFRDALADLNLTLMLNLKTEVARIPLAPFVAVMSVGIALAALVAAWQMLRPPPAGIAAPDMPEKGFDA
jgi:TRAP-type C4-dicarboxylate transport system permease small subunit